MIDYLSNQSNHCKTYETLVNMGFSGDCFRVRFSHPLLLKRSKALYLVFGCFYFVSDDQKSNLVLMAVDKKFLNNKFT